MNTPDPSVDSTSTDTFSARVRHSTTAYAQRISYSGLVVATVLVWLSVTPSLLPRGPLFQGLVSAGAGAIGYAIGAFVTWLARYLVSREAPWPRPARPWWIGLGVIFAVGTAVMLYWFARWQTELRDMFDAPHLSWGAYPQIVLIALVAFAVLLGIGQGCAAMLRLLRRRLDAYLPPRISVGIAFGLLAVIAILILNGVVAHYGMAALNSSFAALNKESTPDSSPPSSPLQSGGPGSLVSWESLGRMGRAFVSTGPTKDQIADFNHAPAMEPIRAYAGLESAESIDAAAELAAQELVRAGGLQRKLIGIACSTGTGWVNRANPDSLEYMFGGDTAMVSMQYSMLPSALSFLVDQERARQAGRALFEAVDRRVRDLPAPQRPKIVVFGESLGSFGSETPFGSIPTLASRTDGALFVGPTFSNTLWDETTTHRDPGSSQILPVYQNGRQVRFIQDERDLDKPAGAPWDHGRIVYLQHPSDPITWWNPELLLNKPDWLSEPRGTDVLPSVHWIPIVTFLQVAADMTGAVDVPDGHGHHFLRAIPKSWAAILEPPGWTDAETERLLPRLTRG